jgi:hypothetical protein
MRLSLTLSSVRGNSAKDFGGLLVGQAGSAGPMYVYFFRALCAPHMFDGLILSLSSMLCGELERTRLMCWPQHFNYIYC